MKKLNKVLIVDDDQASIFLTQMVLEEMRITNEIHTADTGKDALVFLEKNVALISRDDRTEPAEQPNLIFLDINMPVMDGFEFLDHFEKMHASHATDFHVVLLTTSINERDVDKAKKYNVVSYMEKPITEEKINIVILKLR
ncbi:MAG: response regulator [Ferruginibacter sp.]|nr:response regulator [Cytophagales bacterium]